MINPRSKEEPPALQVPILVWSHESWPYISNKIIQLSRQISNITKNQEDAMTKEQKCQKNLVYSTYSSVSGLKSKKSAIYGSVILMYNLPQRLTPFHICSRGLILKFFKKAFSFEVIIPLPTFFIYTIFPILAYLTDDKTRVHHMYKSKYKPFY